MISQSTIEQVENISIVDAVNKVVTLKKKGVNWWAISPFNSSEKTPSFCVNESKNMATCFSTGTVCVGPITAYMKLKKLTYLDSIKELAQDFNITISYDESDKAKEYIARIAKQKPLYVINEWANHIFQNNLSKVDEKELRVSEKTVKEYGLGFALDDWNYLEKEATKTGKSKLDLVGASLLSTSEKNKKHYDFFRNRIMFPIYDQRDQLIGFSGRTVSKKLNENGKAKDAKYINSKDTSVFWKRKALYGIQIAKEHLVRENKGYLVEGNFDVLAMYENGLPNTVAPCGTALTNLQANLLKKYCDTVCVIFDNDKVIPKEKGGTGINAGVQAAKKAIACLLEAGFIVEVCFLPEGEDPDSYSRKENLVDYIENNTQDAVEFVVADYYKGAKSSPQISKAQQKTEQLLVKITDNSIRDGYVESLYKIHKFVKTKVYGNIKLLRKEEEKIELESNEVKLPKGANYEDYQHYGFCEIASGKETGYHFTSDGKTFRKDSNFIIKPLFHVKSQTDNKRIIQIKNKRQEIILDLPSKALMSQQLFADSVYEQGNFIFHGSKVSFQKVVGKISEKMPTCHEIKTLGWQDDQFFAFSNGAIIDDRFHKVDEYGIIEKGDKKYFLPAFSSIYKHLSREDDIYENDRSFVYTVSKINFEQWAKQMVIVHGDNGSVSIAFLIAALFRDHIFSILKVFPHLFLVGDIETGKSYCSSSLNAIFHGQQPPFNLTSGTKVGMIRRLAKHANALQWFDEYDNEFDKGRYDLLKGAYDGAGYEKGLMSNDNRTITNKIMSASIISGQHYATRDSNALFSRCINLIFLRKSSELTNSQKQEGAKLKAYETEGISSIITEILKFRELIETEFSKEVQEVQKDLKNSLDKDSFSGRVLINYSVPLTCVKILESKIKLPYDYGFLKGLFVKMIAEQSAQIGESDALHSFWKTVEYLFLMGSITSGEDFKIYWKKESYNITEGGKTVTKHLEKPKDLIYLRLSKIHPLYMVQIKNQNNQVGINVTSLKSYFKSNKAYLGRLSSTRFDDTITSGFVFDYKKIGIVLDKTESPDPDKKILEDKIDSSKKRDDTPF